MQIHQKRLVLSNLQNWRPRHRRAPRPTECALGFSMWHVVAWGLLEPDIILGTGLPVGFLEQANNVKGDILIDDLRESTWGCLTNEYRPRFPDKRGLTLDLANLWFVNRSVAELCLMARTPLFGFWEIEDRRLHPVVRAFNKSLPL